MSAAVEARPAAAEVWGWLAELPDPEIPAVSLVDLGIVRDVGWEGERLVVTVTPTYSGCPATAVIRMDILDMLAARGLRDVEVRSRLSPPWTTAWISAEGREKLRGYGIAPPVEGTAACGIGALAEPVVPCPRCGAEATRRVSQFGSTPCKSAWVCEACREPFDHFKCH